MIASGGGGKTGRSGSAEKISPVPHSRIEDESVLEEIYEMGQKLGQGSFGIVREVIHRKTGKQWACKAINKEKAGSSAIKLLEREVGILKRVHHEHIIRLKEVLETANKMYLVMECCEGGELCDVLKEKLSFNETETKTIMTRLASAIHYLHKNDMVHRDIKLENILMSKNPADSSDNLFIKVTDFGLSVVKGGSGHDNMMMDFCGTPMYMAPEIIDNKYYSERCDVWAMGVIMFTILFGHAPFQSKDEEHLYELIKTVDIAQLYANDEKWKLLSEEGKDVLCRMLAKDPAYRLSCHEVLDHPWTTGCAKSRPLNVLELMSEWHDDLRNGSDDSKNPPPVIVQSQSQIDGPTPAASTAASKSPQRSSLSSSPKLPNKVSSRTALKIPDSSRLLGSADVRCKGRSVSADTRRSRTQPRIVSAGVQRYSSESKPEKKVLMQVPSDSSRSVPGPPNRAGNRGQNQNAQHSPTSNRDSQLGGRSTGSSGRTPAATTTTFRTASNRPANSNNQAKASPDARPGATGKKKAR